MSDTDQTKPKAGKADQKSKARHTRKSIRSNVKQSGNPYARFASKRVISLTNVQLTSQLRQIDYFGLNYSSLLGAFIKAGQQDSIAHFDRYIERVLNAAESLIDGQTQEFNAVLKQYENKGYVFDDEVKPTKIQVTIYRSCVNQLVELYVKLDHLITLINRLEKTPFLSTPDMFSLMNDWSGLPKHLSGRILALTDTLAKRFSFHKKQANTQVDFDALNKLLIQQAESKDFDLFGAKKGGPVQLKAIPGDAPEQHSTEISNAVGWSHG